MKSLQKNIIGGKTNGVLDLNSYNNAEFMVFKFGPPLGPYFCYRCQNLTKNFCWNFIKKSIYPKIMHKKYEHGYRERLLYLIYSLHNFGVVRNFCRSERIFEIFELWIKKSQNFFYKLNSLEELVMIIREKYFGVQKSI